MRVALILVGLSTLTAMELKTLPRTTKPVVEPPAQAAVGSYDTLTRADRLVIPHRLEARPQPISSSEVITPQDQTSTVAQEPSNSLEQHKRSAGPAKAAVALLKARPRHGTSKVTAKLNRATPVAEVKSCTSGVFDGLLRALNLPTRCQT
jgi:hypothetical protein